MGWKVNFEARVMADQTVLSVQVLTIIALKG